MAIPESDRTNGRTSKEHGANRNIAQETSIIISREDQALFVKTLLNPPAPNDALKAALKHYNQV